MEHATVTYYTIRLGNGVPDMQHTGREQGNVDYTNADFCNDTSMSGAESRAQQKKSIVNGHIHSTPQPGKRRDGIPKGLAQTIHLCLYDMVQKNAVLDTLDLQVVSLVLCASCDENTSVSP